MSTYIASINKLLAEEMLQMPTALFYGENIDNGSRISGLTRNFKTHDSSLIINVGNCEYTHCGIGFGMMLNGATAVLFVKQLDFMLLGIDHFVSTYQSICCQRSTHSLGSFTIVSVVYDQGFQGPQSSFNAFSDICSMARVPGYMLTNSQDSEHVIRSQLQKPGFRFIVLSQKLSPKEMLSAELVHVTADSAIFQYFRGEDVTIACFNFTFSEGFFLHQKLKDRGLLSSIFSVNNVFPYDWTCIKQSVARTGRLVVLDDSKSINLPGYMLLNEVAEASPLSQRIIVKREDEIHFGVSPDSFHINYDEVISKLLNQSSDRDFAIQSQAVASIDF